MVARLSFSTRFGLFVAVVVGLVAPCSCSLDHLTRNACREALRAAWRAYSVPVPAPDDMRKESEARFDSEGRAAIASLDSARAALPAGGGPGDHYFSATLGGLVTALRDQHDAILTGIRVARENDEARASNDMVLAKETYDRGLDLLRARSAAGTVAERVILRLAAWERRFLRESYLADSYEGSLLAAVEGERVKGAAEGTLLHRSEIEARIAAWDSVVVVETRSFK